MLPTRLEQIVAAHRASAALEQRPFTKLMDGALAMPAPRSFHRALEQPGLSVIAELKRRSPSAGDLAPLLDPATVAAAYAQGGAACLSVLTDEQFFGGSVADLQAARAATQLPVLRKDFTVSAHDIADARLMGADAVLLIVAALDIEELALFHRLAGELQLTALVEVHDREQLRIAADLGALVIGVNQRNLHTFEIDEHCAERLIEHAPAGCTMVAESGIGDAATAARLAAAGYHAILVGSSLVTSADPATQIQAMIQGMAQAQAAG